jgi:hypothetical protein
MTRGGAVPEPMMIFDKDGNAVDVLKVALQYHGAKTYTLFNERVFKAGEYTSSVFIDCMGFSEVAITFRSSRSYKTRADIYWSHDEVGMHGCEYFAIPSNTGVMKSVNTAVKARYMSLLVFNEDIANDFAISAWAYLKT